MDTATEFNKITFDIVVCNKVFDEKVVGEFEIGDRGGGVDEEEGLDVTSVLFFSVSVAVNKGCLRCKDRMEDIRKMDKGWVQTMVMRK